MRLHRLTGPTSILAGVALVAAGFMTSAAATSPGNNGTIKVDGWEVDNTPANEPHVGCTFGIDFYGYEAKLPVTMQFEVQPPTGDEVIYTEQGTLDDDDATGGGSEEGHDGHFAIDLTDALSKFTPHPQQGYHLKLTVTVDDQNTQGAQVKHKVFWTSECAPPTTTTTTTTSTTSTTTTTTTSTTTTSTTPPETTTTTVSPATTSATTAPATTAPATTAPNASTTPPTTGNVAPEAVAKPKAKGPEVLGLELARTGMGSELLALGAVLVLLGVGLEVYRYATRRRPEAA